MDILEKQVVWFEQKPLFEAEFIHSHLLPSFNFNENTGDYEIKSQCLNNIDDEDRKVAYETLNTGWVMWLRAKCGAKAQAVPEGFVVLKISDVREILSNASDAIYDEKASTVFSETGSPSTWYDYHLVAEKNILDAIEAQESSHD